MPYRAPHQRAITPQDRGRFPGYDVLDEVERWDDVTAGAVLARLSPVADLSFFSKEQDAIVSPLCDLLLAQDGEPKIPVVALIDARLALGETDGWHYDDLPEDGEAWRRSLAALDEDAEDLGGCSFARLDEEQQAALVQRVQALGSDGKNWHDLPASRVWSLWTRYACTAFYAHPDVWSEIGFPGPAYPRGYKNIGVDRREPFEVRDARPDEDPVR